MGYQVYKVGHRWGGYGVPAICEHPNCNKEIDRGVSYACGGEPFSQRGCDMYFCEEHLFYKKVNEDGERVFKPLCERCCDRRKSFPYKPETKEWIDHILTDESWEEWRKNNPDEVKQLNKVIHN